MNALLELVCGTRFLWSIVLLIVLALPGCSLSSFSSLLTTVAPSGTPPLVTARENATANMTLIACPVRPDGQMVISDLIQSLSQQSPVVTASEAGTARLIINTCPTPLSPELLRAAGDAARARR